MPAVSPLGPGDPRQVSAFRLLGRLGEGGQGTVFLGRDADGRRVAVKLLHARLASDERARARFAAEVRHAERVAALCTAPVIATDVDGDVPYIVSEYVDGPSLAAVVAAEGPRSGAALDRLAIGTITALAAIHGAGVVHRDFKPSNVLLADDGPRVIDFGIARALDDAKRVSSAAVGTPAYMAPEQIEAQDVGPPADVFAWGCTMVFAATGAPPFGNDAIPAVLRRILLEPPDTGSLGEPLLGLVRRCLDKDPAGRPTAQQILIRLLTRAGALPAAETSPENVLEQGERFAATPIDGPAGGPGNGPRRGRRGIAALTGGAGALVAVGAAVVLIVTMADTGRTGGTGGPRPGASSPPPTGPQLNAIMAPPTFIDPSNASSDGRPIVSQLFTGLVQIGRDGTVRRRLATDLRADPTCRTWTIDIRSGTRFSNGEPVDAAAFVRGWTRAAQSKEYAVGVLMADIEGYTDLLTERTNTFAGLRAGAGGMEVKLTAPDCEFDKRLGNTVFFPVPVTAGAPDNKTYNDRPIGNGPFTVESYTPSRHVVLKRNPSWAFASKGKATPGRVVIDLSEDYSVRGVSGITSGAYDLADVANNDLGTAQSRFADDGRLRTQPVAGTGFLLPVTTRGAMKSREARLAVSFALDRKAITAALFAGTHPPSTGLVPAPVPGFTGERCRSCARPDPSTARWYAERAGLGRGTAITLLSRGDGPARWPDLIEQQLEDSLGWKVKITTVDTFEAWREAISAEDGPALATYGWFSDYPSAFSFLHQILGGDQLPTATGGGFNYAGWRNAGFDRELSAARTQPDEATRIRHLRKAEDLALDDMALIPLWNYTAVTLTNRRFTDVPTDFYGSPDFGDTGR
ncbi:ABC transporter substrate-binding protein [Thermomonospora umbrina]|uniref:ABC-type transport system substrate-binding protein n=1 Tax=Thermomonospora umbrina TaxID=111806 RepID=A0A3D9SXD1_9ACTN|nr:ABC transporter substrate-binding protein [Thermomonospora umbrina]REE97665.1 ABC-type transport system substrate-binding protein [Thermomonospora umbrina]